MVVQLYFVSLLILLLGCQKAEWKDQKDSKFSERVRGILLDRAPKLEPINFDKILGRTPASLELEIGRNLFNDTILSRNNDVSCASCHLSNHGFADGNPLSFGSTGRGGPDGTNVGKKLGQGVLSIERGPGHDGFGHYTRDFMFRNTLSTINVAYRQSPTDDQGLFHDGRFGRLSFQVVMPIHTPEELCGSNPIALDPKGKNVFRKGGAIFATPVELTHVNSVDDYSGRDSGQFNATALKVDEIPYKRPDGSISIPNRNECLALAIAKIRLVPWYKNAFSKVYKDEGINNETVAKALMAFILTHVSKNTPYDQWVNGKNSLSNGQLLGLLAFMTPIGKSVQVDQIKIQGAGCFNCHSGATFGGQGFANLGVRSDPRSSLARPQFVEKRGSGFFDRPRVQRGLIPSCHIAGSTATQAGEYAPDIGRANGSFSSEDCFKFRVAPLRNVIETYPFFHHGTETARGSATMNLLDRSYEALTRVIQYHLRGPIHQGQRDRQSFNRPFFDDLQAKDYLIPFFQQNFVSLQDRDRGSSEGFPVELDSLAFDGLVDFVAFGLWDQESVSTGALGNPVTHPERVPSGFSPSITRDDGHQLELPPAYSAE
jgi:cytochrome c peroxidase